MAVRGCGRNRTEQEVEGIKGERDGDGEEETGGGGLGTGREGIILII